MVQKNYRDIIHEINCLPTNLDGLYHQAARKLGVADSMSQVAAVVLLPIVFGIQGGWISIVVAELMAVIFSTCFLVIKRKKYQYF